MLTDVDRVECGQVHLHDEHHINTQKTRTSNPVAKKQSNQYLTRCFSTSTCSLPDNTSSPSQRHLYHLTGVVVHHGRGFQSGHYTAYCLNDEPGKRGYEMSDIHAQKHD